MTLSFFLAVPTASAASSSGGAVEISEACQKLNSFLGSKEGGMVDKKNRPGASARQSLRYRYRNCKKSYESRLKAAETSAAQTGMAAGVVSQSSSVSSSVHSGVASSSGGCSSHEAVAGQEAAVLEKARAHKGNPAGLKAAEGAPGLAAKCGDAEALGEEAAMAAEELAEEEEELENQSPTEKFLWKPKSESDGKLVVLLPTSFRKRVIAAAISQCDLEKGCKQVERGRLTTDDRNGYRPHFRFSKPGSGYNDVYLIAETSSTAFTAWKIPRGANRHDGINPSEEEIEWAFDNWDEDGVGNNSSDSTNAGPAATGSGSSASGTGDDKAIYVDQDGCVYISGDGECLDQPRCPAENQWFNRTTQQCIVKECTGGAKLDRDGVCRLPHDLKGPMALIENDPNAKVNLPDSN